MDDTNTFRFSDGTVMRVVKNVRVHILLNETKPKKRKTYEDDFLEKFPNADFKGRREPYASYCVEELYGAECQPGDCAECWNREMEE